jgi:ATP-dependent helicase HepA
MIFELLERFDAQLHEVTDAVITETQVFYKKLRTQITEGRDDPRIGWLVTFLRDNPKEKVLVICRMRSEVAAMVKVIRTGAGVDVAHFHEQMPLIKCDRQAAWFAEPDGARIMVVSEMGGEGRNFQFASHLVLIDLPRDPELLEQRIGRLDRIGQRGDVHIHVPYLLGTKEEQVVRWMHEGLNAFAEPVVGGFELLERFDAQLHEVLSCSSASTHSCMRSPMRSSPRLKSSTRSSARK